MTGRHAGSSADEVARRHREKIARLERSAAHWEAGAAGERVVGEVLDRLASPDWTVLHDVAWPGRQKANIDHVAVGPGGVFVVDAKNWSGRVEVRDGQLRQNGRSRHEALDGVARATLAVRACHPRVATYGVLCLVSDEPRRDAVAGVTVCSSASLLDVIGSAPEVLTPEQVASVSQDLADRLRRSAPVFEAVPKRAGASRRGRSSRRPVVALVAGAVLVGSLATGAFSKVTDAVSGFVSDVVVDAETPQVPAPKRRAQNQKDERKQQ